MRRCLPLLLLLLLAAPAHAADCAKLLDGHSPLHGAGTQSIAAESAPAGLKLTIDRPDHTMIVIHKDGADADTISDYDRQILVASRIVGGSHDLAFRIEPDQGDPWALNPGAQATYRQGVSHDGVLGGVEIVVQTVGPSEKRTLSGCEVEIVPIHREIGIIGGGSQRIMDIDYAPALRLPLRIVSQFMTRAGEQRIETSIDSLEAR
jgi:hypothetical protein